MGYYRNNLKVERDNVTGGGGLLWQTTSAGETSYPMYDGNGNITVYANAVGEYQAMYAYDGFLNVTQPFPQTGTASYRYQASTKSWNPALGLLEYQFRAYSPELGRWIQEDPIGETGGKNLYGFVRNNAVSNSDIDGTSLCKLCEQEADSLNADYLPEGDAAAVTNGSLRFTKNHWTPEKGSRNYILSLEYECNIVVTYKRGQNARQRKKHRKHEMVHVGIIEKEASVYKGLSDYFNGYKACPPCTEAVNRFIEARALLASYVSKYENAAFDCAEYPPERKGRVCAAKEQRAAKVKQAEEEFEKARESYFSKCEGI